ncbi:MAG: flagellar hook capping FlgD N-terminal domain-containing protein [Ghiorsea sp.]|nr:flagellar hook capping FlgD N-terminal domain-containing protein [Ghiorsea sp.]
MPLNISTNYGAQPAAAPSGTQNLGTKEVFLKMLVAQMENQDPLNPADSSQMSSQLAQFNMVEQQMNTNKYLEQMAASQGASNNNLDTASAGYLGHTVMLNESNIQYTGSTQPFNASLDKNASTVYVTISDSLGTPVRNMSLSSLPAGDQKLSWDGKDDFGNPVTVGDYNIDIAAFDAAGQAVTASIQRSGVVDAVRMSSSGIQLIVGGTPTSIANVTEVRV